MKITTKIRKWGNEYGILLPESLMDMLSLKVEDELLIEMTEEKIILTLSKKKHKSLTERFSTFKQTIKQDEYWTDDLVGIEKV